MGTLSRGHRNNDLSVAKAPMHMAYTERFKGLDGISQPQTGEGCC